MGNNTDGMEPDDPMQWRPTGPPPQPHLDSTALGDDEDDDNDDLGHQLGWRARPLGPVDAVLGALWFMLDLMSPTECL